MASAAVLVCASSAFASEPDAGTPPVELDTASMDGKQVWTVYCATCHGEDGTAKVPEDRLAGMEVPPRDLTEPYFNSRERRSDWERVVRHGGQIVGLSASMPAWGEVLSDAQIAGAVEHIKSFVPVRRYPQGENNYFRAHRVTKAFIEQEALLIPTFTRGGAENGAQATLYYANRFFSRAQYEIKVPFVGAFGRDTSRLGLGDIEVGLKYSFFDDWSVPYIVSAGFELGLPTATGGFGASAFTAVPYVAAGMGIAEWVQLQASVGAEIPLGVSLGELRGALSATLTPWPGKQGLFPGVEVFASRANDGTEYGVSVIPKLFAGITPLGHIAVSVGLELPVAGVHSYDWRAHAFLLWDYVDGGLWW